MTEADKIILWSTALAVIGVAVVEAMVSYGHAYAVVLAHTRRGVCPPGLAAFCGEGHEQPPLWTARDPAGLPVKTRKLDDMPR